MIGVISDTHDNLPAIKKAVKLFNDKKVELVLHAGDIVSPFTVRVFKDLKCPMKGVFGNNDGDHETLISFFDGIAEFSAGWLKLNYGEKTIYLTHQPLPEVPSDSDLYIFGHTHKSVIKYNNGIIVNPGECAGWLSSKSTVALVDIKLGKAELIVL